MTTELDKIALEVANECFMDANQLTRHQITEFARRLVAKLSDGQEPVRYEFQDREGNWHAFADERHYQATVKDGTWPIRALYIAPPLTADTRTLDVLRKALTTFEEVITACKSEPAMQARKYIPLGVDVFNVKDSLRALITELEN